MVCIKSFAATFFLFAASVSAAPVAEEATLEKRAWGSGPGTYYYQNGNPGACGKWNKDSAYIVALNSAQYGGGKYCGKTITLKNKQNGKVSKAVVADLCPSCGGDGQSGIDLSEGLFKSLGNTDQGVLPLEWWFSN